MSAGVRELPAHVLVVYALGEYRAVVPLLQDVPEGEYACPHSPCSYDCPQCWGRGTVWVFALEPTDVRVLWSQDLRPPKA